MTVYIGYPTLEAWAETAEREEPVYACLVEEPQPPSSQGLQDVLLVVWAAQRRGQEVHYFRCRVGLLEYIEKTPFGNKNDHRERKERAGEAWGYSRTWLEEKGFEVREGVIAYPKDLKLFEGWPRFLEYDKERKEYVQVRKDR